MRLFEGGIYAKITDDEYQKLRWKQAVTTVSDTKIVSEGTNDVEENDTHLRAMSMKTLQGAFYVLIIGYLSSGNLKQPDLFDRSVASLSLPSH